MLKKWTTIWAYFNTYEKIWKVFLVGRTLEPSFPASLHHFVDKKILSHFEAEALPCSHGSRGRDWKGGNNIPVAGSAGKEGCRVREQQLPGEGQGERLLETEEGFYGHHVSLWLCTTA